MILGTGVDLIEIERFRRSLERYGDLLLDHLFTQAERTSGEPSADATARFAMYLATKRAAYKALRCAEPLRWHDLELVFDSSSGGVMMRFRRKARQFAGQDSGFVSLSHTAAAAMGFVVIGHRADVSLDL